MTGGVLVQSQLPLPLLRHGKVREVYEVDEATLLLVASDRVSAFDVVMREAVPHKGAVLTQMSAFWFRRLASVMPHHCLTANVDDIVARIPALRSHQGELAGRAMLTRRATPVPFECVVRGYIRRSFLPPPRPTPGTTRTSRSRTWRAPSAGSRRNGCGPPV